MQHSGTADGPSATAAETARDVVLLYRQLRQRMRELPAGELSAAQVSVLLRLDRDGASSTTLLASAEGVRSQSMTATLNGLGAAGLISRRPDPEDGRRTIVVLSDAGREAVRGSRELRHQWLADALGQHLSPSQIATLAESIGWLAEALTR